MSRSKSTPQSVARASELGRVLREMREQAELSREALARRAGVATETVRKIEQGATTSPELFTFAALIRELDASIDDTLRTVNGRLE